MQSVLLRWMIGFGLVLLCGAVRADHGLACQAHCAQPDNAIERLHVLPGGGVGARSVVAGNALVVGVVSSHAGQQQLRQLVLDAYSGIVHSEDTVLSRDKALGGNLGNAVPFRLKSGAMVLGYRDHVQTAGQIKYRLKVAFFDGLGPQWDTHEKDDTGLIDAADSGLWEPFFYYDAHNDLRVVYAKERETSVCGKGRGRPQDIVMKRSIDGGRSWTDETVVASAAASRDGVPSVARLHDGSYVLVFESWQGDQCQGVNPHLMIRAMQSTDGVHWERRQEVYLPRGATSVRGANGSVASWPYVLALHDGRIAVAFTTDESHTATQGNRKKRKTDDADRDRQFDIKLLLTKSSALYSRLDWDHEHLITAFPYGGDGPNRNHYASLAQLADDRLVVFSAQPARYVLLAPH